MPTPNRDYDKADGPSTTYRITKKTQPGSTTSSQGRGMSADGMEGKGNQLRAQGYDWWQAPGVNADNGFGYDSQTKSYKTLNSQLPADYLNPGAMDQPPGGGPGSRGPGGGGGGGGGLNPADFAKYAAGMRQLLGSNFFDAPKAQVNPLTGMVDPTIDREIGEARDAYGRVAAGVSQVDPYLQLLGARAPQVQPEMEGFLRSQGVQGDEYGQAVGYANAQLGANDANWSNYGQAAGQNFLQGQQGTIDLAKLQGENVVQGYEGQRGGLNAMAAVQQLKLDKDAADKADALQQQKMGIIMDLLSNGMKYGVQPDLTGLF